MASWGEDSPPLDPVPPGHGESAAEINTGEARCRCGMRLNRDGSCPIHGPGTSLRPRPGESAEETVERVVTAVREDEAVEGHS